jgi:hypothetical protein
MNNQKSTFPMMKKTRTTTTQHTVKTRKMLKVRIITVSEDADNQDNGADTTNDNPDANINADSFRVPRNINRLQNSKFLSARELYQHINKKEHVFDICPPGNKSNSWFLIAYGTFLKDEDTFSYIY